MSTGLVDFHCHLDLHPDFQAAVAAAEAARVYTLSVTTTPHAWPRNLELTRNTKYVRAALGLHPQLVADREDELSLWEKYLVETRYIGEVGLDAGPRFYKSLPQQMRVFERILKQCAEAGGKILSIHSIRTSFQVLNMVEKFLPPNRGRVVMHWFTGKQSEANKAIALGCYFSINAAMAGTAQGQSLISSLPLDRLLTETDSPFALNLNAIPQPTDVEIAVNAIAQIKGIDKNLVAQKVRDNLRELVSPC
jgi:TatD DNase family protein